MAFVSLVSVHSPDQRLRARVHRGQETRPRQIHQPGGAASLLLRGRAGQDLPHLQRLGTWCFRDSLLPRSVAVAQ